MKDINSERQSAVYRFNDPIESFRIRVVLRQVISSHPGIVHGDSDAGGNSLLEAYRAQGFCVHEYTFKWQEKIFSTREYTNLREQRHCKTPLEQMYHQEIARSSKKAAAGNLLFSYVDNDQYVNETELKRRVDTSSDALPAILVENTLKARQKKSERHIGPALLSHCEPVRVLDQRLHPSHALDTPFQWMHIMGDLGSGPQPHSREEEYVLCSMKVGGNGVLEMRPDFTGAGEWYKIESRDHNVYEYTLENVSLPMDIAAEQREKLLLKSLFQKHQQLLHARVGLWGLQLPPADVTQVYVRGEIVSGAQFSSSNLFVHYMVDVPEGWQASEACVLSAFTQVSASTNAGHADAVSYFSLPIELEFAYRHSLAIYPSSPLIYFQVGSVDWWGRHRVEGYGYASVPLRTGVVEVCVKTWRPLGDLKSRMRRFFTGGDSELSDVTFVGIPSTFEGVVLGKYGVKTKTSGSVLFRFNTVMHAERFVQQPSFAKDSQSDSPTKGSDMAKLLSTATVLEEFQKARQRMQAVRKSILTGSTT